MTKSLNCDENWLYIIYLFPQTSIDTIFVHMRENASHFEYTLIEVLIWIFNIPFQVMVVGGVFWNVIDGI